MRVTLVIASLGRGGAERVLCNLANAWAARGDDVTVLTLGAGAPEYALRRNVTLRTLGVARVTAGIGAALRHNVAAGWGLRRAIRGAAPDVVISFLDRTNVLTVLASRRLRIPVVVAERSCRADDSLPRVWRVARAVAYARAAVIVVQTVEAAGRIAGRRARRVAVVPNPVLPGVALPPDATRAPVVLGLGRLVPEKGFDRLLDAFAAATRTRPGWRLVVHGDGPSLAQLEAHRRELGLDASIAFPGTADDPESAFREARIFALSSRVEGFPNALCEAMASGLPAVAFSCPCGPAEIVRDGLDGLLVAADDTARFATALGRLMDDADLRRRLGDAARGVVERFSLDVVLARWDAALAAALRTRR